MGHARVKETDIGKTGLLLKTKNKNKESDIEMNARKDHLAQNDPESLMCLN